MAAEIDAAGTPRFMCRPVWPADAYGVIAAEDKAGKTWVALDAAVSVASGTPWLGYFEVDDPGAVLIFMGEGGKRKIVRRIRAVSEGRGIDPNDLPIRVSPRVPHLMDKQHVERVREELAIYAAKLVIVDPLYLAARGSRGSDLYEMGACLEDIQHACQNTGAALMIIHHWNKTGRGKGAGRMSGVGPGAWGRVLGSGNVEEGITEPNGASRVTMTWGFIGDEIPDVRLRVQRRVWTDDPNDLGSPMHYETTILLNQESSSKPPGVLETLSPAQRRVALIVARAEAAVRVDDVQRVAAAEGGKKPLRKRTVQDALAKLVSRDLVNEEVIQGGRGGKEYISTEKLRDAVPTADGGDAPGDLEMTSVDPVPPL
jgi:hypothetical protein